MEHLKRFWTKCFCSVSSFLEEFTNGEGPLLSVMRRAPDPYQWVESCRHAEIKRRRARWRSWNTWTEASCRVWKGWAAGRILPVGIPQGCIMENVGLYLPLPPSFTVLVYCIWVAMDRSAIIIARGSRTEWGRWTERRERGRWRDENCTYRSSINIPKLSILIFFCLY